MLIELKPIFEKYLRELKPLIAEYESRNEMFPSSLLEKLPFMFDNIALYSYDGIDKSKKVQYKKDAENYLNAAIVDMKLCLMASIMENVKRFKSHFPKKFLYTLNNGNFWGKFKMLENEVRSDRSNAFPKLKEMESMIENCHDSVLTNSVLFDSKRYKILKIVLSIIISLVCSFIFSRYF